MLHKGFCGIILGEVVQVLKKFSPDLILDSIYELNLKDLQDKGIKGIITDLDNTLVAWNVQQIEEPLKDWLKTVKEAGFKVCILSNNSSGRVEEFAARAGVPAVSKAVKPRRGGFRRALEQMGLETSETAVLGDQLFTDILGGNRTGLYTILVTPLSQKEFFGTRIMRQVEKILIRKLKEKGLLY